MVRAHSPVRKVRVSRHDGRLMFMSPLADMVTVIGSRSQAKLVRGPVMRGYVGMYSTLNSTVEQGLRDRRVEDRTNATRAV